VAELKRKLTGSLGFCSFIVNIHRFLLVIGEKNNKHNHFSILIITRRACNEHFAAMQRREGKTKLGWRLKKYSNDGMMATVVAGTMG